MKIFKSQGVKFRSSSFSNIDPVPFCVAVGQTEDGRIAVRRSQDSDPAQTVFFDKEEWAAFIKGAKAGEFDF